MKNANSHTDDWECLLVDYADGTLSSEQVEVIEAHLQDCPDCRAMVTALNESLASAQAIWNQRLEDTTSTPCPHRRQRVWIGLAAGMLLAMGLTLWWFGLESRPTKPQEMVLSQQDVQACGQAAKLLAAAEMLARLEQHRNLVQQQYQYIIDTYPNTPSASLAQVKLKQ